MHFLFNTTALSRRSSESESVFFWFCLCVVFMVFFTFAVVFVVVVFDGNRDRLVSLLVFLFMLSRWYVSA